MSHIPCTSSCSKAKTDESFFFQPKDLTFASLNKIIVTLCRRDLKSIGKRKFSELSWSPQTDGCVVAKLQIVDQGAWVWVTWACMLVVGGLRKFPLTDGKGVCQRLHFLLGAWVDTGPAAMEGRASQLSFGWVLFPPPTPQFYSCWFICTLLADLAFKASRCFSAQYLDNTTCL